MAPDLFKKKKKKKAEGDKIEEEKGGRSKVKQKPSKSTPALQRPATSAVKSQRVRSSKNAPKTKVTQSDPVRRPPTTSDSSSGRNKSEEPLNSKQKKQQRPAASRTAHKKSAKSKHHPKVGTKKPSIISNILPSRQRSVDVTDATVTDRDNSSAVVNPKSNTDTTTITGHTSTKPTPKPQVDQQPKRQQTKPVYQISPISKEQNVQNWIEPSQHVLARKARKTKRKTKKDMPARPQTSIILRAEHVEKQTTTTTTTNAVVVDNWTNPTQQQQDKPPAEELSCEEFVRPMEDERNLRPAILVDDEDERTPDDDTLYELQKQMKEYGEWPNN